ncbi:MAG: PD40 domain-containing protein [Lewinellaceae bacterium]|nr:PD40 domain-containing protein [Lewinellaceae bacterium]
MNPRHLLAALLPILIYSCANEPPPAAPVRILLESAADTVELFAPTIISSRFNERDIAISPDGTEIFYTLSTPDNAIRAIIQLVQLDGKWQEPRVAPFSGTYSDIEPSFSPDGKRLYFASNRPTGHGDEGGQYDIWFVDRNGTGWGAAQNVGAPVNTPHDEFYPSVASNGNLYFTAAYENSKGAEDIYRSVFVDGQYQTPVSLDSNVNSTRYEFNAFISPDEDLIIFTSYGRADDLGGGDLYMSTRNENDDWLPARNLGPKINSAKLDYCPFLDTERQVFYFTSSRRLPTIHEDLQVLNYAQLLEECEAVENGMGNIYRINARKLFE